MDMNKTSISIFRFLVDLIIFSATSKLFATDASSLHSLPVAPITADDIKLRHYGSERSTEMRGAIVTQDNIRLKLSAKLKIPDGIKNALASGAATGIVKAVLQPFDTIKTVQQMQRLSCHGAGNCIQAGLGAFETAKLIVAQHGICGLWSGLGITVFGSSPSVAVYFGVYSSVKDFLLHRGPLNSPGYHLFNVAIAAAIGNSIASVFRVPYEPLHVCCQVLKQRVQAGQFPTAWAAMVHSWRIDGPLGLFDAGKLSSQIVRDVPYAILTLVSYELLQGLVHKRKIITESESGNSSSVPSRRKFDDALCGSIAGGIGSLLTNPMDVVKTRLMTSQDNGGDVWTCVARILTEEGPGAFLIGTPARLMHKIPANGLFFLCYELFRTMLGVSGTGQG